jgi:hypothetical protein
MTLLVGADKKRYLVHSSVLAANSETLRALCEGSWAETHTREIDWSEWEEATVKRFLEWIYTGDYSVPGSSKCNKMPPAELESHTTSEPIVQQPQIGMLRPLTPLKGCFTPLPATKLDATSLDKGDFSVTSMAHAKLYVLAQYTNTPALENAALGRLHKILVQLVPSNDSQIVESIVNLVVYVYSNTNALVNSEEPMRRVISTFCAVRFLELLGHATFQKLQSEGGDFVVDFWEKAGRLISWDRMKSDEMIETQEKVIQELTVRSASLGRENTALLNEREELKAKNSNLATLLANSTSTRNSYLYEDEDD